MRDFHEGHKELLKETFKVIREYLYTCGWHEHGSDLGQLIDPITLRSVTLDYAYTLQLSRNMVLKSYANRH